MKKKLFFVFLTLQVSIGIAQNTSNLNNGIGYLSYGINRFSAQKIISNYPKRNDIRIFSQPTYALSVEFNYRKKIKKYWFYTYGVRLATLPNDRSVDFDADVTVNGFPFDDHSRFSVPYISLKGGIARQFFKNNWLSINQTLGGNFIYLPSGFYNDAITSLSSGQEVVYYRSKGRFNPNGLPFFSLFSETDFTFKVRENKYLKINFLFEVANKDAVKSNYSFFTKTEELTGTITRRFNQIGVNLSYYSIKNKKK